ncbi:hypothetical protein PTSG_02730 [Salpingoeca rosetta]|uniref:Fibronectin type-III domain-containing protein n=1 Tax=Salpingoeca rosetta (strain ATCC 50818 / BSB-021) TaxID=946362 RepID=F2U349_SALR5|nr:uncharacterized protein PTSG_02730 [Salpingoeca rosetta]EGD82043.1 hypothetical protein PTSG_02730 [Salpingoeca rosetta]|eukprot:XP_004996226.1 hypothetical protein PTSG_02730 [Salpingoeca rosetta]
MPDDCVRGRCSGAALHCHSRRHHVVRRLFAVVFVLTVLAAGSVPVRGQGACTVQGKSALCTCYEDGQDFVVDCRSHGLAAVPAHIPINTTILSLSNNKITSLPGRAMQNLTNLHTLYLDDNGLETVDAGAFAGLHNLAILSIVDNALSKLPFLAELLPLRTLDLEHNRLTFVDMGQFTDMFTLATLNLGHNRITGLDDMAFDHANLRALDLSHNDLSFIAPLAFSDAPHLSELDLSSNRISVLAPSVLDALHNLTHLDLSANDLTELPPTLFDTQTRLASLRLADNRLASFSIDVIGNNPLSILRLNNNTLETLAYNNDTRWANLTQLYLRDNPWYCCGMEWFRDAVSIVQDLPFVACAAPQRVAGHLIADTTGPITICTRVDPDAPSTLNVTSAAPTSATAAWPRPHGNFAPIDYYTLDVRLHNTTDAWLPVTCTNTSFPPGDTRAPLPHNQCRYLDHEPASMDELATPLHATITGLLPFTAYDVRVRAVHGRGVSGFTTAGVVTAEDVPSRPAAPLVLEVRQRAVRVNISAPTPANGRIVAYDVRIVETRMETPGRRPLNRVITLTTNGTNTNTNTNNNNNNINTTSNTNANAREYTISDLRPATPYNVSVRGVTSAGAGPFSAPALVTTLPAAPATAPSVVHVRVNATACLFEWLPLARNDTYGQAPVYTVYAVVVEGVQLATPQVLATINTTTTNTNTFKPNTTATNTTNTADNVYVWTMLETNSTYAVVLSANTTAGEGPLSLPYTCVPNPTPPPRPLPPTIDVLCADRVRVSWQPPAERSVDVVDRYELYRGDTGARVYAGAETSAVVADLVPGAAVSFFVIAHAALPSEPSVPANVTMPSGVPDAVDGVMALNATAYTLNVTWTPASSCAAPVQSYLVFRTSVLQHIPYYPTIQDNTTLLVGIVPGNVTGLVLSGLRPATTYSLVVRAFNKYGGSDTRLPVNLTTADAPPSFPGTPSVEVCTNHYRDAANGTWVAREEQVVRWTQPVTPNGNITRYELWHINKDNDGGTLLYAGHPGHTLQVTVPARPQLDPSTLVVIAFNAMGASPSLMYPAAATSETSSPPYHRTTAALSGVLGGAVAVGVVVYGHWKVTKTSGRMSPAPSNSEETEADAAPSLNDRTTSADSGVDSQRTLAGGRTTIQECPR